VSIPWSGESHREANDGEAMTAPKFDGAPDTIRTSASPLPDAERQNRLRKKSDFANGFNVI